MDNQLKCICDAISFIEAHPDDKPDLDSVSSAIGYSKYHLHRLFSDTVGMTIKDYTVRRQLTEAAKLLVFSDRKIIDIALTFGYESQQSFTTAFKSMYKIPPAEFRASGSFYPLQLRFTLKEHDINKLSTDNISFAEEKDIHDWMELVRLAIDGFPYLDEEDYLHTLKEYISEKHALILKNKSYVIGAMLFSDTTGSIDFLAVDPQYRGKGIEKLFLDKLMGELLPDCEISITTYRENDRADTGYRAELKSLGFAEKELLTEFGYPTQRFVLPPNPKGDNKNDQ